MKSHPECVGRLAFTWKDYLDYYNPHFLELSAYISPHISFTAGRHNERPNLSLGGNKMQGVDMFFLHDVWANDFQQHRCAAPLRKDFK